MRISDWSSDVCSSDLWTPTFAPNLTLTLDYFNIKIENAIQRIDGSTKLAICYESPGLSHPFCGSSNFTRNALTGEIDFLSAQPVNAASERVPALDLRLLYRFAGSEERRVGKECGR